MKVMCCRECGNIVDFFAHVSSCPACGLSDEDVPGNENWYKRKNMGGDDNIR